MFFTFRVALIALAAFAPPLAAQSDAEFQQRLVGKWREVRVVDCERHEQQISLRPDKTFEVQGSIDECGKTTYFVWRGTWQVKGAKFGYKTTYSNAPHKFPLGEVLEDSIASVTEREWVMVEQSTGNRSVARRVP